MSEVTLTSAMRNNLAQLRQTSMLMDTTQNRIATGNKVNSALDDPTAFFKSKGLKDDANDLSVLKDDMGQTISSIQAADKAITSITSLVDQAKSLANSAKAESSASERLALAAQFDDIRSQIDTLAADASYGGQNLVTGRGVITGGTFLDTTTTALASINGGSALARVGTDTDVGSYAVSTQQKASDLVTSFTLTGSDAANDMEVFVNGTSVGSFTTSATNADAAAIAGLSSELSVSGATVTATAGTVVELRDAVAGSDAMTDSGLSVGLQTGATAGVVADLTSDLGIYGAEVYAHISGYTDDATDNNITFSLSGTTLTVTDAASGATATLDTSVRFTTAGSDSLTVGDLTVNFITSTAAEAVNTTAPVSAQSVAAVAGVYTQSFTGTFEAGDTYTLTINGNDYSAVSASGTTATTMVTDWLAANSSTGASGGTLSLTGSGGSTDTSIVVTAAAGVLTFTAQTAGDAMVMTEAENVDAGTNASVTQGTTTAHAAQQNTLVLAGDYDDGDIVTATVNSNTVSYTVQTTDIGASAAATLANVTNALATAVNANTTLINGTAGVLLSAISDGTDTITFVENGNGTPTILSGTNSQSAISLGNETSTSSTQALKSLAAGTADGDARIKIVSNSATETVDISTTSTTAVTISNAAWGSTFSFTGDDANVVAGDSATVTVTNPTGTGENDAQVVFNTDGTSTITVQAVDTTSSGLSISATANSWAANSDVDAAIAELDAAKTSLRSNSKTMATSLGVIQTRETFTENFIDNLRVGADKLTLADGSEEATNMLMLQTRQQLGIQALSMASQSSQSILSLFR